MSDIRKRSKNDLKEIFMKESSRKDFIDGEEMDVPIQEEYDEKGNYLGFTDMWGGGE